MFNGGRSALDNRNTQAARDALRRRQKEKKSRIVKRHVLYKQKQKLLKDIEGSETAGPIIAPELGRPGFDEDNGDDVRAVPKRVKDKRAKFSSAVDDDVPDMDEGESAERDDANLSHVEILPEHDKQKNTETAQLPKVGTASTHKRTLKNNKAGTRGDQRLEEEDSEENEDGEDNEISPTTEDSGNSVEGEEEEVQQKDEDKTKARTATKKYIPFLKEKKEYEKLMRQRDRQERERQGRIKKREKMLKQSKKRRAEVVSCLLLFVFFIRDTTIFPTGRKRRLCL